MGTTETQRCAEAPLACNCTQCNTWHRAKHFARYPEKLLAYEAKLASAARAKIENDALKEQARQAYALRFRYAARGEYAYIAGVNRQGACVSGDIHARPEWRRVYIHEGGHGLLSVYAVHPDASPSSVWAELDAYAGQATDGVYVCQLVRYETDEEMMARVAEGVAA